MGIDSPSKTIIGQGLLTKREFGIFFFVTVKEKLNLWQSLNLLWVPKNWCFWTVVLEKTLESPLYSKEIKPVNPEGSQPWIFIGRTDAEAEVPIFWPPDVKSRLIGKDPDAGKDWGQEEKGATEDEIVGWHYRLNGHEWANSGREWRTGNLGVLKFMGSQSRTWLSKWTATTLIAGVFRSRLIPTLQRGLLLLLLL